jgi:hypothetical protein
MTFGEVAFILLNQTMVYLKPDKSNEDQLSEDHC